MAGQQCLGADTTEFALQDINSYFNSSANIWTDAVPASSIRDLGTMGTHGIPKPPLNVYKGVLDELSPVGDTDALVSEFCKKKVRITYDRNLAAEHLSEAILGAPAALTFLIARMNGDAVPANCIVTTIDMGTTLVGSEEAVLTQVVYEALQGILASGNITEILR